MCRIFDRNSTDDYVFDEVLKRWEASRSSEERALAINLRCDHRVSPERAEAFKNYFKHPYNGKALKIALNDYHRKEVRKSPPAFQHEPIADYSSAYYCDGFDSQGDLANILNLNYLFDVLGLAQNSDRPEWKAVRDVPHDRGDFAGWLDRKLAGKSPESTEIEEFIYAVFALINYNKEHKWRYNPP